MRKLKKFLALGLSAVLMTSLAACGASSQGTSDKASQSSSNGNEEAATDNSTEAGNESQISYENCALTFSWWGDETTHETTLAAIEAFEAIKLTGVGFPPTVQKEKLFLI